MKKLVRVWSMCEEPKPDQMDDAKRHVGSETPARMCAPSELTHVALSASFCSGEPLYPESLIKRREARPDSIRVEMLKRANRLSRPHCPKNPARHPNALQNPTSLTRVHQAGGIGDKKHERWRRKNKNKKNKKKQDKLGAIADEDQVRPRPAGSVSIMRPRCCGMKDTCRLTVRSGG